jgi:hypothetical protein
MDTKQRVYSSLISYTGSHHLKLGAIVGIQKVLVYMDQFLITIYTDFSSSGMSINATQQTNVFEIGSI